MARPRVIWKPTRVQIEAYPGETLTADLQFLIADARGRPRAEELIVVISSRRIDDLLEEDVIGPLELFELHALQLQIDVPIDARPGWYPIAVRLQDTIFSSPLNGYCYVWVRVRGDRAPGGSDPETAQSGA